jgi:Glycosyl transferase family 2
VTARGISIVVPTLGRASLGELLAALAAGPRPDLSVELIVVDDRPDRRTPLPGTGDARVLPGRAAGPAAARNIGWRAAAYEWVAFLDDDVLPDPDWLTRLAADLRGTAAGGVQGNLRVPLPAGRRPTDWERVTAALADGRWITADMAYRREALAAAGGFDERLPRAFREDAELAFRVRRAGWRIERGGRTVTHPVRPESRWVSVRTQRGNADDALLRRMYGPGWRELLEIPAGRRPRHAAVTAAAALALGCAAVAGVRGGSRGWLVAAAAAAAAWAGGTAEFAAARIVPGPRDPREVVTMLATSAVIPPVATAHWVRGWLRWRGARPLPPTPAARPLPAAPGTGLASAPPAGLGSALAAPPAPAGGATVPAPARERRTRVASGAER